MPPGSMPYQPPPAPPGAYQGGTGYEGYPPPEYATPYQPAQAAGGRTNTLAIVALICSLAGFFIGISAPVGAVLGHVATRQIRQTGEEGAGMAKAAIIVGWILTGIFVIGCCIAGIAILAAANYDGRY
jgi:hypothetical protein